MKYRLLNSAMMPQPGKYHLRSIPADTFAWMVRQASEKNRLESYVGYPQTADYIAKLSGVPITVSRQQATVKSGDILLICRLAYRPDNPAGKGKPVDEADFEFFYAEYERGR